MNIPIIETHGLSKWFGEVVALNNVDLSIPPGLTGVLGPNGAGKSTFIKLMLGLYRPSRGEVRLLAENPRNNANVLKKIGYCPEIDAFHENLTGFEFVHSLCRHWGMGRIEAREAASQACEIVRMTDRMHDPIDEYSKGMRQRIKIAQALAVKLYHQLAPGGVGFIGNMAPVNPSRFTMEYLAEWTLLYRNADQVMELGNLLPVEASREVVAEPTGINLFLVTRRPRDGA